MLMLSLIVTITVLLMVRNWLALRWAIRMIEEIHHRNLGLIDRGKAPDICAYNQIPSHGRLMLDIRIWSYERAVSARGVA